MKTRIESGGCYLFIAKLGKINLILHTTDGDIDIEYSVEDNKLNVSGAGGTYCADCSVETATIIIVELKNWHKQFPDPSTLPTEKAMHNVMLLFNKIIDFEK